MVTNFSFKIYILHVLTWTCMKEAMVKASEQVCGKTKGPPRHKETWWWSEEVSKIVEYKDKCYQRWFKAREEDSDEQE